MAAKEERIILFSCPATNGLARKILSSARGAKCFEEGSVEWRRFPDGFPNLFIENVDYVRGREVMFLAYFGDSSEIFTQLSFIYALPRYLVKKLTIVLPYFPTGTNERIDHEGQVCTAMTLARMIGCTPISQRGSTNVMIYDIHHLQERFYFNDFTVPLLVSAIPLLLSVLKTQAAQPIAVAFPDEGAQKRFGRFFVGYEIITCSKVRQGTKRVVTIKEGEPRDHHVIIVDDLVMSGGTLGKCQEVLLKHGARSCSAYVTHAVFPNESWRRFASGENQFERFYITDSVSPVADRLQDVEPFEILSIADSIVDETLRFSVKQATLSM
mmetsp:Transcript_12165/g.34305  ORF Transcript_12165/g.34305 Transcript_12165/m.34305 type:complete len:326 (-) Transcript_12165:3-980(-)